jgi:hypothetical protein
VVVADDSMSRVQCRFLYEFPKGGWRLQDGDIRKRSLNGTWVVIEKYCEIYHTMVLKANSALILVLSTQAKIEPVEFKTVPK